MWHVLFGYLFLPFLREAIYSAHSVGFYVDGRAGDHGFSVAEIFL